MRHLAILLAIAQSNRKGDQVTASGGTDGPVTVVDIPPPTVDNDDEDPFAKPSADEPEVASDLGIPQDPPAPMPSPFDSESSPAIRAAMSRAIETGETQRWSDSGHEGYVLVSPSEPTSGCRSVYYTIDTDKPAWKSPTQTICPH